MQCATIKMNTVFKDLVNTDKVTELNNNNCVCLYHPAGPGPGSSRRHLADSPHPRRHEARYSGHLQTGHGRLYQRSR